jgi:hypothetical protein
MTIINLNAERLRRTPVVNDLPSGQTMLKDHRAAAPVRPEVQAASGASGIHQNISGMVDASEQAKLAADRFSNAVDRISQLLEEFRAEVKRA